VIAQRLRPLGFTGGLSILKDYLHRVRAQTAAKNAASVQCFSQPRSEIFSAMHGHPKVAAQT
jgi:hypothetical protein